MARQFPQTTQTLRQMQQLILHLLLQFSPPNQPSQLPPFAQQQHNLNRQEPQLQASSKLPNRANSVQSLPRISPICN